MPGESMGRRAGSTGEGRMLMPACPSILRGCVVAGGDKYASPETLTSGSPKWNHVRTKRRPGIRDSRPRWPPKLHFKPQPVRKLRFRETAAWSLSRPAESP
jgi:hypothetical protein